MEQPTIRYYLESRFKEEYKERDMEVPSDVVENTLWTVYDAHETIGDLPVNMLEYLEHRVKSQMELVDERE